MPLNYENTNFLTTSKTIQQKTLANWQGFFFEFIPGSIPDLLQLFQRFSLGLRDVLPRDKNDQ